MECGVWSVECGVKERFALEYKKEKSIAQRIISEVFPQASVGVEGVWTSSRVFFPKQSPSLQCTPKIIDPGEYRPGYRPRQDQPR